ncbi:hypothetical protein EDC65_5319 [Stella humosa]|uniref:Peptidase M12A domain-containing protein n=2 Tax=Stella humosa TaxID=94 RepID=A0A3N1KUF2_9PROT|nr:hypothetical protein EDC65_5319 [Stella humosa]BBK29671.1 hypothetical protein STHU_03050 [Stella humosa]
MLTRRLFVSGAAAATASCLCSARIGSAQSIQTDALHICTELILADVNLANRISTEENPNNKPVNSTNKDAEAISLSQKKWHPKRRILSVDFTETVPFEDKIIKFAKEWEQFMGMRLKFGRGDPDILASFSKGGSWSYVGTDSRYFAKKGIPSMNFGWFDRNTQDSEFSRTTLHEFGHALSLVHEQQHPHGEISWKKEKVYAYYKNLGWEKEDVDKNIFAKYDLGQINGGEYDRHSIMHYPIPAELVSESADVVGWNNDLSANDKIVIGALYPDIQTGLPL